MARMVVHGACGGVGAGAASGEARRCRAACDGRLRVAYACAARRGGRVVGCRSPVRNSAAHHLMNVRCGVRGAVILSDVNHNPCCSRSQPELRAVRNAQSACTRHPSHGHGHGHVRATNRSQRPGPTTHEHAERTLESHSKRVKARDHRPCPVRAASPACPPLTCQHALSETRASRSQPATRPAAPRARRGCRGT